jgi:hypothetical protein
MGFCRSWYFVHWHSFISKLFSEYKSSLNESGKKLKTGIVCNAHLTTNLNRKNDSGRNRQDNRNGMGRPYAI